MEKPSYFKNSNLIWIMKKLLERNFEAVGKYHKIFIGYFGR